jgi:hypothetical protein
VQFNNSFLEEALENYTSLCYTGFLTLNIIRGNNMLTEIMFDALGSLNET